MNPEHQPWRALGRVQTELGTKCTGALLGPRLVLTAAHCLVAPRSGQPVQPSSVHVLLGYERGRWRAAGRAQAYRLAPGFEPSRLGPPEADWALLTLERPMPDSPLPLWRSAPVPGARLMLGGYQQDRMEVLLADPDCRLLGVRVVPSGARVLRHGCAATRGASGGPLLMETAPGQWSILGIAVAAAAHRAAGLAVPVTALPPDAVPPGDDPGEGPRR